MIYAVYIIFHDQYIYFFVIYLTQLIRLAGKTNIRQHFEQKKLQYNLLLEGEQKKRMPQ